MFADFVFSAFQSEDRDRPSRTGRQPFDSGARGDPHREERALASPKGGVVLHSAYADRKQRVLLGIRKTP